MKANARTRSRTGCGPVRTRSQKHLIAIALLLGMSWGIVGAVKGNPQYAKFSGDWRPGFAGPPVDARPTAIRQTLQRLRAVPNGEFPEVVVREDASEDLTTLKHQLRELFLQILASNGELEPTQLQALMIEKLKAAAIVTGGAEEDRTFRPYPGILEIRVEAPGGQTNHLALMTTLGIPCGTDSSLYLFERSAGVWKMVMALESDGYVKISGGQQGIRYSVAPRDSKGNWFAVVTRTPPWCTSVWRVVQWRVLRPGPDPYAPRELFSRAEGINLGDDEYGDLKTFEKGFRLIFWGSHGFSPMLLTRAYVENYLLEGDTVTRKPPYANSPDGFFDEWVSLPWTEAMPLSAQAGNEAQEWHERLNARYKAGLQAELEFVQPCKEDRRWQLGFSLYDERAHVHSEVFATVGLLDGNYALSQIGPTRPKGCPGEAFPGHEGKLP